MAPQEDDAILDNVIMLEEYRNCQVCFVCVVEAIGVFYFSNIKTFTWLASVVQPDGGQEDREGEGVPSKVHLHRLKSKRWKVFDASCHYFLPCL